MKHLMITVLLTFFIVTTGVSQTKDSDLIRATAKNFMEGWYEGDPTKMEKALQEDAVSKVISSKNGFSRIEFFSALELVQLTRKGGGKAVPQSKKRMDITILDIYQNAATVKIHAYDAVEYLHLAKWRGKWKIINILFERTK